MVSLFFKQQENEWVSVCVSISVHMNSRLTEAAGISLAD